MRKLTLSDITPTPKPQLKTSPVNRVIFINDRSVSMGSLRQESVNDTLEQIKLLAEKDAEIGSETFVSVVDFGARHNFVITSQPAKEVRTYIPEDSKISNGSTALSKTLVETIEAVRKSTEAISTDEAFLVILRTDGLDNTYQLADHRVREVITSLPQNWTVTLIGPSSAVQWARRIGIPEGNTRLWDGSAADYAPSVAAQNTGLGVYAATRGAGGQSVGNFYTVNTAKVTEEDIARLKELPKSEFTILKTAINRQEIASLIRDNSLVFKKGVNYYELLKNEFIQEDKDLLLMDAHGRVFGRGNSGAEVRRALGLPTTGTIKVTPQMGQYTVFVQSNSNNRKMICWTDKKTGEFRQQRLLVLL